MDNVFSEPPTDLQSVVAVVKREAAEECPPHLCAIAPVLDSCARDAVESLWDSRIKTFVPLLSLRRVRSCIRAGTCDTDEF